MTRLEPWLHHKHSMTDKLKTFSNEVTLNVLTHTFERANLWDQTKLHLKAKDKVLHREILMLAGTIPCWYARTVIPQTTYDAKGSPFSRLQSEALGDIIWSNPSIARATMQHFEITPRSLEYTWLTPFMHEHSPSLWARLSTFAYLEQHRFFLLEILLPGLMKVTR
ncbi:MAG: chorismate--pyruvate lyase family protein [Legionellaceae bacterium]